MEIKDFENMAFSLSKYNSCNAKLLFLAIKDDLNGLDLKKDFSNYVSGIGVIEFAFLSCHYESKTYQVKFARIKGFDIDVKNEFENFKMYAKEFVEEFSNKIGIPILLNEEISNN